MLVVHGLTKSYAGPRQRTVFADVRLELSVGDYVAVMGESGIGKSTLLNLIAGLDSADEGSIQLDGLELTTLDDDALTALRRKRMGFVFQAFHVLPYLTVAQNVALPLSLLGVARAEPGARVATMRAGVGLGGRAVSMPRELSRGVQFLSGDADLQVRGPRSGFDEAVYPTLARLREVAAASPVIELDAKLADRSDVLKIIGIDVFRAGHVEPGLVADSADRLDHLRSDTLFLSPAT